MDNLEQVERNPLSQSFDTAFGAAPFSKIKLNDFDEMIPKAIDLAKKEVEEIAQNMAEPTFENTVEALEASGQLLSQASSLFFNLNSAETSEEMQQLAQKISPLLSEFSNDVLLNEPLFVRIKKVWDLKNDFDLNEEQHMLLKKNYKKFVRNGALLDKDQKDRIRNIDKKLAELSLRFGENVLKETNKYVLFVEDEIRLSGMPTYLLEAAKQEAEKRNKEGWAFTLQYPSYVPFMKYCPDRALRKELAEAFGSKAFKGDELDNQQNVLEIASLRKERAEILGYESHAHFVLEDRMAKSPNEVNAFLQRFLIKAKPAAEKELEEIYQLALNDGIAELESYDHAYYAEKLRKLKYDLSDEALKAYFSLDQVERGAFEIAKRLYGITFRPLGKEVDVYHKDVKVYEVLNEEGKHLALFYADYFPREGKRAGAWMTAFRGQHKRKGKEQRPHVSIVCNFTPPTKDKPALLTFDEVRTLFHEFGHALHGILADTTYESLSGTHVLWDFVELPSQFMENFCFEKETLALFAKHYETGEVIPDEIIERLKASAHFMAGYQTVRQIGFSMLDMRWHGAEKIDGTVPEIEEQITESARLYPTNSRTNMSCSFAHIFQGGYSAGYYSYKWAEVLDADAFEFFIENGIFDQQVARKFKKVLSSGGTIEPMKLYKDFRGQEPSEEALLRRSGLIV